MKYNIYFIDMMIKNGNNNIIKKTYDFQKAISWKNIKQELNK